MPSKIVPLAPGDKPHQIATPTATVVPTPRQQKALTEQASREAQKVADQVKSEDAKRRERAASDFLRVMGRPPATPQGTTVIGSGRDESSGHLPSREYVHPVGVGRGGQPGSTIKSPARSGLPALADAESRVGLGTPAVGRTGGGSRSAGYARGGDPTPKKRPDGSYGK